MSSRKPSDFDFNRMTGKIRQCCQHILDGKPRSSPNFDFRQMTGKIRQCMINNDMMDAGGRLTYKNYKGWFRDQEGEYTPIDYNTCYDIDEGDLCCLRVQLRLRPLVRPLIRRIFLVLDRANNLNGRPSSLTIVDMETCTGELVCHPTELVVIGKG